MSQFTEADSSVNRLNAAVTAFEKVLTEPEGTVVEMPIGAAQPSLAERLKRAVDAVTVKPAQAAAQASAAAQQARSNQPPKAQQMLRTRPPPPDTLMRRSRMSGLRCPMTFACWPVAPRPTQLRWPAPVTLCPLNR